jgi:hypothetical protein
MNNRDLLFAVTINLLALALIYALAQGWFMAADLSLLRFGKAA